MLVFYGSSSNQCGTTVMVMVVVMMMVVMDRDCHGDGSNLLVIGNDSVQDACSLQLLW
jgi:hypothetical protein